MVLISVGKGSYGAVYKARDLRTSELVAIKVISLSEGVSIMKLFDCYSLVNRVFELNWDVDYMQEEGYEEIRGEIEMLQQCSHPNVVRYLGSYQGEEYLWVGSPFVD